MWKYLHHFFIENLNVGSILKRYRVLEKLIHDNDGFKYLTLQFVPFLPKTQKKEPLKKAQNNKIANVAG